MYIPINNNMILIIWDVDNPNKNPLYSSPRKNSKINLPTGYNIKYNPNNFPFNLLLFSKLYNMINKHKLYVASTN